MPAPVLTQPIPTQVINEGAAYGPVDLKTYIQVAEGGEPARFQAGLKSGEALPKGMICTEDGILTGIPAKGTQALYEVKVTAENANGKVEADFLLTIKPSLAAGENEYINELKNQIWEALKNNLPPPDMRELLDRPISQVEIYHLLERWGTLTVWDAFNLDPPSTKELLSLTGTSEHYNVFDCGSCLIMAPKDLYSHERTLADALQTARVLGQEVYRRDWTIQMVGPEKFTRAAWVEIKMLGDKFGKQLEVINFNPTPDDAKLYLEVKTNRLET